jgi:hypothetical protein
LNKSKSHSVLLESFIYGTLSRLGVLRNRRGDVAVDLAEDVTAAIEEHFLVIDRDELPPVTIEGGLACDDSGYQWKINSADLEGNRYLALRYLASTEAIEKYRAETTKRDKRRDELAFTFTGRTQNYMQSSARLRLAIDYIVELEEKQS